MSEIHRTAARGFDAAADVYERARPDYPAEAIDHLIAELPAGRWLDLAAGTGKMTRQLVARGIDCVAVEPVAGMRARLREALPDVEVLEGTAEAIPLPEASVDAVVVAQAFHWFSHDAALAEIHRVLRPAGRLALVWNVRDESVAWVKRITDLIKPYEGADGVKIPRHREGGWRAPLANSELFRAVGSAEFAHGQEMTAEGLVERMASTSFIAVLPDAERARVLGDIRALTDEPPLRGKDGFVFPYVCEAHIFERT